MPRLVVNLDSHTTAALHGAASVMMDKSPFVPERKFPHITLLGSLHTYDDEAVLTAAARVARECAPITGRFVKWELTRKKLRVLVECDSALPSIERSLQADLPRGRTWRPAHVNVGSLDGIDPSLHADFLKAVEAAFPIVRESRFSAELVEYEKDDAEQPNPPTLRLQHTPRPGTIQGPHVLGRKAAPKGSTPLPAPVPMDIAGPRAAIRKKPLEKPRKPQGGHGGGQRVR